MDKIANITSGECLNAILNMQDSIFVPFNEAMVEGTTHSFCFSPKFIKDRAKTFRTTEAEYLEKMSQFLCLAEKCNSYDVVRLYFGKDMFCQINMLAVLSYLESRGYSGKLESIIVDEVTGKPIFPSIDVRLGSYMDMYQTLIVDRTMPSKIGVIDRNAITCYLDYKNDNSKIAVFIKNNLQHSKQELFLTISSKFSEYGLGDGQVFDLIDRIIKLK